MNISARFVCIVLTISSFFPIAAHAEDCRLQQIASLDFTEEHGNILVPVSIEGISKEMAIDTGSPLSAVDPKTASDLHLITQRIYQGAMFTASGQQFIAMAVIHALDIGGMHAGHARFLVWPSRLSNDGKIAGVLGADFTRHYDIELDFAAHKLNLFSQDHCPGKVVYWTTDPVAVVPMHVVDSGHIVVLVTLDGHDFNAVFDTGASGTVLSLEAAENDFKLTPDSPELSRDSEKNEELPFYRHVFKTLVLGGVAISNPTVYVRAHLLNLGAAHGAQIGSRIGGQDIQGGMTDLVLGMRELQHLHIYIAYKEQKLYISAAAPPQSGTQASSASAPKGDVNPSASAHSPLDPDGN